MRLIDADALTEKITPLRATVNGLRAGKGVLSEHAKQYHEYVAQVIEDAPTIDAVPVVHGHFEHDNEAGEYICTVCGHMTCGYLDLESEHFAEKGGHGWRLRQPHYCKHCGAKMDEEVE